MPGKTLFKVLGIILVILAIVLFSLGIYFTTIVGSSLKSLLLMLSGLVVLVGGGYLLFEHFSCIEGSRSAEFKIRYCTDLVDMKKSYKRCEQYLKDPYAKCN
jgi:hypothetical protein